MATSGSANYNVTRDDVITEALRTIGALPKGAAADADDKTFCAAKLNMLVKQWMGAQDFAPGLKFWLRRRAYLFLAKGTSVYSLGPSGDHCSGAYVTTTLSVGEPISETAIAVTSDDGILNGDQVGIELDDGTLHWDVVNGSPAGNVVTLTTGLAGAAAAGNRLFAYTTKLPYRPLSIVVASLRNVNGEDTWLEPIDLLQYEQIPDKGADGDPSMYYYEAKTVNGVVYFDQEANDVTKVIRLVYHSPVQDFDAATDDADYPQVWYLPLSLGLAKLVAPQYGRAWTPDLNDQYTEALSIARNADPEMHTDFFFQPDAS